MTFTAAQTGLLRAIDSKDFANVAEYVHRRGAISFPGLRFVPWFGGEVLIEYDPANRERRQIYDLVAAFHLRHVTKREAAIRGEPVRVPTEPRFRIKARKPERKLILPE